MRNRLLPALLALAAIAVAALTATPATAGSVSNVAVCQDATFSSLAALAGSTTARAATPTTRAEKATEKYSGSTEIKKGGGRPSAGTIDVYFHIVQATDGTGAVSQKAVDQQLTVLNLTFSGFYGGYDTGFRFRLAATDTTVNDAWFEGDADPSSIERDLAMKTALKRGDAADLNIYSTSGAGFLGFAYYPSITHSNRYEVLDGVVVHYGSLPGGFITNYDLGYTATHEVGHYLGLPHTFEQGCIGHGDYVDDTPYMSEPTTGCPAGKDTCTRGSGLDPIHNYMDYSYDACYTEFTQGQTERMQKQFAHWRLKRT